MALLIIAEFPDSELWFEGSDVKEFYRVGDIDRFVLIRNIM